MLNLLKLKEKNNNIDITQLKKGDDINVNRNTLPSNKYWYNSIYTFDKTTMNSIIHIDYIINSLIKMYFNLNSNTNLDKKFIRRRTKERHQSAKRIYVSKAEIKHSNDKIIITLYTYNQTKKLLVKNLSRLYRKIFVYIPTTKNMFNNTLFKLNLPTSRFNNLFLNLKINKKITKFMKTKKKLLKSRYINKYKFKKLKKLFIYKYFFNLYKNMLINKTCDRLLYSKFRSISITGSILFNKFILRSRYMYNILKDRNVYHIIKKKNENKLNFFSKISNIKLFNKYKNKYYNTFIKETLKKEMLYLKYNQLIMSDDYKYNNIYLSRLGKIISNIYNKKIEFNIINVKYMHLDSKIFSHILSLKIKNRSNNLKKIIRKALTFQKINKSRKYKYLTSINYKNKYNLLNKSIEKNVYNDVLHVVLNKLFNISLETISKNMSLNDILSKEKYIYRSIKYRKIRGVRLEAKGRLTRRLTASKSIYKYLYRGSLKSLDTISNIPCVVVRGTLNSNIDYINLNYKTRNGSFGLKGWISSK